MKVSEWTLILICPLTLAACNSQKFGLAPAAQDFTQKESYSAPVDMLFVMDNTGSMQDKEQYVLQQSGTFLANLQNSGMSFHIGVVTTDMLNQANTSHGRLLPFDGSGPNVLANSTPNLLPNFLNNMNVGTKGSITPQGLAAMRAALSPGFLGDQNAGFLRDGSFLSIIFMSAQDDHGSPTENDVANLDQLRPPLASGDRGWMADYVGVLQSDSTATNCTTNQRGFLQPGLSYINLAQASNGVQLSICSGDFSTMLNNISSAILQVITEYHLARQPIVTSIAVYVNGQLVPEDQTNGWTYIAQGYTIKFNGSSIPPVNANIHVDFQPATAM